MLTRWHRQRGEKVWYLTGTDEHGQKIMRTAEANGVSPQEWCDKLVEEAWKPLWEHLDIANDDFIRTTEKRHTDRVRSSSRTSTTRARSTRAATRARTAWAARSTRPTANCWTAKGSSRGRSCAPIHKTPVEMLQEENYFFKLSEYGPKLLEHYEAHPEFIQPESARNEVVNFVRQGLEDLSISRSTFDWGVKVPWDDKHVIYVWIDALLNYATAVGYGADQEKFEQTFPADVHLVGKDILRFHAVIWPAMLMANGLPLPGKIAANGWLMVGGEKMSKSNLTGISPQQLTEHFGVDAYRWYFLRAIAFGQDGSFSWEDFTARYTSELANDYGNLASRVAAMVGKYFGGTLPEATAARRGRAGRRRRARQGGRRGGPADRRRAGLRRRHRGGLRLRQAGQRLPHGAGAVEGRQGRVRRGARPGWRRSSTRRPSRCARGGPAEPGHAETLRRHCGTRWAPSRTRRPGRPARPGRGRAGAGSPPARRSPRARCSSRAWRSRRRLSRR